MVEEMLRIGSLFENETRQDALQGSFDLLQSADGQTLAPWNRRADCGEAWAGFGSGLGTQADKLPVTWAYLALRQLVLDDASTTLLHAVLLTAEPKPIYM